MISIFDLLFFLGGFVIASLFSGLLFRLKIKQIYHNSDQTLTSSCQLFEEKIKMKDQLFEDLHKKNISLESDLSFVRTSLQETKEKNSALEEKTGRIAELEQKLENITQKSESVVIINNELQKKMSVLATQLEEERKNHQEKLKWIDEVRENFSDNFKALSLEALKSNNQAFLELAKGEFEKVHQVSKNDLENRQKSIQELVSPLKESLNKVDLKIQEIEKNRTGTYASISEQVKSLQETQLKLKEETSKLVNALKSPSARGRWGEIQLQRVVELAGMVEYCDFIKQVSVNTEEGKLRPDMVIRLPNQRKIVVDSKVPLSAYLESIETKEESVRDIKLKEHARHVRNHISQLSSKAYWKEFPSLEFVVLFLPGETIFNAALEKDPALIETGANQKVILATPTTLIALLRAVAYGWRQEQIAEHAKTIHELGKELYSRLNVFSGHFSELRKGLVKSVDSFNQAIGSYESRVLITARKFKELGASHSTSLEKISEIDTTFRNFQPME